MNVAAGRTLYQDLEKKEKFEHHFKDKHPRNTAWHGLKIQKGPRLNQSIVANSADQANSDTIVHRDLLL